MRLMLLSEVNTSRPTLWPWILGITTIVTIAYIVYKHITEPPPPPNKEGKNTSLFSGILIESMISKIKLFSGSMNALYDIIQDFDAESANFTFNNISKIIEYHTNENVKKWYYSFSKDRKQWDERLYKDKAKEILNLFETCGIHKSKESIIKWNEEYTKFYRRLSQIEDGQNCIVKAPYWIYQNDVYEKGLVDLK